MRTTNLALAVESAKDKGHGIHKLVANHGPITGQRTYYFVVEGTTAGEIEASRETILQTVCSNFREGTLVSYEFITLP